MGIYFSDIVDGAKQGVSGIFNAAGNGLDMISGDYRLDKRGLPRTKISSPVTAIAVFSGYFAGVAVACANIDPTGIAGCFGTWVESALGVRLAAKAVISAYRVSAFDKNQRLIAQEKQKALPAPERPLSYGLI